VEDRDPIKQLQHLLDDPGKVLERIARIHSALGSINSASSIAPPIAPAATPAAVTTTPVPKREDGLYHDAFRTLRQIQTQIEERVRPLALLTLQAEVERLRAQSRQERTALDECVERIERSVESCVNRIGETRKIYGDLTALNHRLTELGAATENLPECPQSHDDREIIDSRLEGLRRERKL
jgi:hypothetical protein